ncbi:MAG: winged helix-turn-helix domain-containing protein [Pirellulales bacterium]
MATVTTESSIDQVGETAGFVWQALNADGSLSTAKIVKQIDAPRDIVMQSIGWLAREGKIAIEDRGRSRIVSLR